MHLPFARRNPLVRRGVAAAGVITALTALIGPERIAEVETAGIGGSPDRTTCTAPDPGTRPGAAGHRTNGRTGTGTQKTAGNGAITRRRSTTRQNQSGRHERASGKLLEEHCCL